MLAAKPTLSAAAALALVGVKPSPPSAISFKQAPAGCLVLAVDGNRTVATPAAVVGRGDFSADDLEPRADAIKRMAEETSTLLLGLSVPRKSTDAEQSTFCYEVNVLKKLLGAIADGAAVDEDGAITALLGVHARIKSLLTAEDSQTPEDFLRSSMGQIKLSVDEYISTQSKTMVAGHKRATWFETIDKASLQLKADPTVCTPDEVKMVLKKTVELLEDFEPVYSTRGMAGMFGKIRSSCRALMDQVENEGVEEKTRLAIVLFHTMAVAALGEHKKLFDYGDAPADSLLSSLRRLEVAMREYKMGGPSAEDSDD